MNKGSKLLLIFCACLILVNSYDTLDQFCDREADYTITSPTTKFNDCYWDQGTSTKKFEENCAYNCKTCSNAYTCVQCQPGFTLFTGASDVNPRCIQCSYETISINYQLRNELSRSYSTYISNVVDCCVQEEYSSFSYDTAVQNKITLATSCLQNNNFLIGSYCLYIQYCKEKMPNYTKCKICDDGYILTEDGQCVQCPNYTFSDNLNGVLNENDNEDATKPNIKKCKTCHGQYQCTVCLPGYYLRTNTDRSIIDPFVGVNPSVCEKCPDNNCQECYEGGKCKTCNTGYYYRSDINICWRCGFTGKQQITSAGSLIGSSTDKKKKFLSTDWQREEFKFQVYGCNTCSLTGDVLVCKSCMDNFVLYTPNSNYLDDPALQTSKIALNFCTRWYQQDEYAFSPAADQITAAQFRRNQAAEFNIQDYSTDNANNFFYSLLGLYDIPFFQYTDSNDSGTVKDKFIYCDKGSIQVVRKDKTLDDINSVTYNQATQASDEAKRQRTFWVLTCTKCYSGYALQNFKTDQGYDSTQAGVKYVSYYASDINFSQSSSSTSLSYCYECWRTYKLVQASQPVGSNKWPAAQFTNVYRCKFNDAQLTDFQILQCGPDATKNTVDDEFIKQQAPFFTDNNVYLAPHPKQYYLVATQNSQFCILNNYNCKDMDESLSYDTLIKYPSCKTCYSRGQVRSLGTTYYLVKYQYTDSASTQQFYNKCIACPASLYCKVCKDTGNLNETADDKRLVCDSCPDQVDISDGLLRTYYYNVVYGLDNANTLTTTFNYYQDTNTCKQCKIGCLTCADSSTCKSCQRGYYKDDTNICNLCNVKVKINFCALCQTTAICQECISGFTLYTYPDPTSNPVTQLYQCLSCEVNCSKCQPNQRKTCTECVAGYYLEKDKCKKARQGCLSFEKTGGKCNSCQYGFRLGGDGWCYRCLDRNAGYYQCPQKDSTSTTTQAKTCKAAGNFVANVLKGGQVIPSSSSSTTTSSSVTSSTSTNGRRNLLRGEEVFEEEY